MLTMLRLSRQSFTILLQGFSYFPVSLYIASFTRTLASPLTATVVLSVFNSSAVAGQIVLGHLSDRFPYPTIMVISALGSALGAFFLWGFASTAVFLYFFAIVFGALVSLLSVPPSLDHARSHHPMRRAVASPRAGPTPQRNA